MIIKTNEDLRKAMSVEFRGLMRKISMSEKLKAKLDGIKKRS